MKQQGESSFKFEAKKQKIDSQSNIPPPKVQMSVDILICSLAILIKIAPIILFFTLSDIKILDFTIVLIIASVDFWIVKNIFGRKLVGMTWWMKVNEENGDQQWIFHSEDGLILNVINENCFWGSILGSTMFWGLSTVLSLLISRLFWIALCALCFILSAINFVFFLRCRGNHQQKFKGLADKIGFQSAHRLVGYY